MFDIAIVDAALDGDAAWFSVNNSGMWFLHYRMRDYGMLNDAVSADEGPIRPGDRMGPAPWDPSPIAGIPTFKISYNDGETVTPDEIETALIAYDSWPKGILPQSLESYLISRGEDMVTTLDDEGNLCRMSVLDERHLAGLENLWQSWLEYLRLARDSGFRVF